MRRTFFSTWQKHIHRCRCVPVVFVNAIITIVVVHDIHVYRAEYRFMSSYLYYLLACSSTLSSFIYMLILTINTTLLSCPLFSCLVLSYPILSYQQLHNPYSTQKSHKKMSITTFSIDWVRDVAWAPSTAMPVNIVASCSEDCSVIIWKQTEVIKMLWCLLSVTRIWFVRKRYDP